MTGSGKVIFHAVRRLSTLAPPGTPVAAKPEKPKHAVVESSSARTGRFPSAPDGATTRTTTALALRVEHGSGGSTALVPFVHDLAELAKDLPTLENQYVENGKLLTGNPTKAFMTADQFMAAVRDGTIKSGQTRKFVGDNEGTLYIAGLNGGKQSGHIDGLALVAAKSAECGRPLRVVAGGMVTVHVDADGSTKMLVGNQSGHTMPEGTVAQEQFSKASFEQAFPGTEVVTRRYHGFTNSAGGSSYRQAPGAGPGTSIAELTEKIAQVALARADARRQTEEANLEAASVAVAGDVPSGASAAAVRNAAGPSSNEP